MFHGSKLKMNSINKSNVFSKVNIRLIKDTDNLDELTTLLHRAYKKLADQGFRFHATFQDVNVTKARVEGAECYVGILDGKIVATIAYHAPFRDHYKGRYEKSNVASFGQFAVAPELQEIGIGSKLIELAEQLAIRDSAAEIAFDTAEGAGDLINYYSKRGYNFVAYTQWDVPNYRSVIMSKRLK